MAGFTKALRQQIVEEFARRHNGNYNPKLFLEEVRQRGADHPAHSWFEWDKNRAATQWQIEQAREFARDLRVSFKVEEVGRRSAITVREGVMPLVLSPVSGRRDGGGYVLTDTADPTHMEEHCRQAGMALRAWLNRYSSALTHVGATSASLLDTVQRLEAVTSQATEEAA